MFVNKNWIENREGQNNESNIGQVEETLQTYNKKIIAEKMENFRQIKRLIRRQMINVTKECVKKV